MIVSFLLGLVLFFVLHAWLLMRYGMLVASLRLFRDDIRSMISGHVFMATSPSKSNRAAHATYDKALYRARGRIEIMFGRLKDWRRIAMRYDCAAHTFFSAMCIAAAVIFWL